MVRVLARWVESRLAQAQLEERRRAAESKLGSLFEGAPDGILLHRDGRVLEANRALAEMLGVDDPGQLVGRSVLDFIPVEHQRELTIERLGRLDRGLSPGEPYQLQLGRPDGSLLWVETRGVPVESEEGRAALTIVRDLSSRDEFQRMLQIQRLADIGAMASGVAHELNNPLSALSFSLTNAVEVVHELPDSSERRELEDSLRDANSAGELIGGVTRTLLDYSRRRGTETAHDIHELLGTAVRITRHDLTRKARLVERYASVPRVVVDGQRLTQVFVNLLVNAGQALGEGDPRDNEVRIETALGPSGRLVVSVSDTGPGIAPEDLERIFDRFYTTKPEGEGTGLGLALCREIVEGHGGTLTAEERRCRGARFTVRLPSSRLVDGGSVGPS